MRIKIKLCPEQLERVQKIARRHNRSPENILQEIKHLVELTLENFADGDPEAIQLVEEVIAEMWRVKH